MPYTRLAVVFYAMLTFTLIIAVLALVGDPTGGQSPQPDVQPPSPAASE